MRSFHLQRAIVPACQRRALASVHAATICTPLTSATRAQLSATTSQTRAPPDQRATNPPQSAAPLGLKLQTASPPVRGFSSTPDFVAARRDKNP